MTKLVAVVLVFVGALINGLVLSSRVLTGPIAPVEAQVLRLAELFGLSFHTVQTRAVLLD